jgi:hypothetical protein
MEAIGSLKDRIFGWLFKRRSKSLFPEERSEQAMADFQLVADALRAGRLPESGVWARLQANVEDMLRIKREYVARRQRRRARRGGTQAPPPPHRVDRAMRQATTVLNNAKAARGEGAEGEDYEERIFWDRTTAEFGKFLLALRTPKMHYTEMDWKRMERAIKFRIRSVQFQRLQAMPDIKGPL